MEAETQPKKIVMTHFGRSGSTVVTRMLEQHSDLAWLHELFTLKSQEMGERYDMNSEQLLMLIDQQMMQVTSNRKVRGIGYEIKLLNFLKNPSSNLFDYAQALANRGDHIHIVLQRRNTLKRILSVYKAMRTKVFHLQKDVPNEPQEYRIDFNQLMDVDTGSHSNTLPGLLAAAQEREAQIIANYRKLGINFLHLTYEDDIEQDPSVAYNKILDYLDLPHQPAQVTLKKTSNSMADEVINYGRVVDALVATDFEWMLDPM